MICLKFLFAFIWALGSLSQFADPVFGSSVIADEPVPSRFLLMDDPALKLFTEAPAEEPQGKPISLKEVSKVIGSVIASNEVGVDAQSQEGNNLDYQLDFKNRKLSLVVNMQENLLELKISSDDKQLDKESSFNSDKSSTEEIKSFLTDSLNTLQQPKDERKLLDANFESTDTLLKLLQDNADFSKAFQAQKGKEKYKQYISIIRKGEDRTFCYAEIEDNGPKYLKLKRNLPEEEELHRQEHSVFIRKLASHDTAKDVMAYILESLAKISEQSKNPSEVELFKLLDVVHEIKKFLPQFKFLERQIGGKEQFSYLLLSSKDRQDKDNRAQILIFPQPESTVGIEFVIYDRQYDAQIPLANFKSAFEEIKEAITKLINGVTEEQFESMFDVDQHINKILSEICPESKIKVVKTRHGSDKFKYTTYQHTPGASEADSCVFSSTKILAIQYNYGYVHFIHLALDNRLLRSEYMLSPHLGDIKKNLKIIFSEIEEEIMEIEKLPPLDSEKEITSKILEDTIKGELKDNFSELGSANLDKFAFISNDKNQEVKVSKDKAFFRISFLKKEKNEKNISKFKVLKQIFIKDKDLRDQAKNVKRMTKKFISAKGH